MGINQLSQMAIEQTHGLLLERFRNFCQTFTDVGFYDDNFHGPICDFLQDSGSEKMLILPRGFLKTTLVSLYILWMSTKNTQLRSLLTSNTTPNAAKTVRSIRNIIENSEMYQLFFPEAVPEFSKVRWSDTCACLNRKEDWPEGTFESAGIASNVIRRHFNIISEDDTVAPRKDELTGQEAMPSKDDIQKAVGFHKLTIPLLINEDDIRIITATRWASYDMVSYVLENEKHFDVMDLTAYKDPGTNSIPRYKKFSKVRLEKIRVGLGTYMFSMLYLNQPLAKEFMAFNPDWFRYYEENELPEDGQALVTLDPADPPTGKRSQDYSGILSAKQTKKGLYIRRYRRERLTDKQMIDKTLNMAEVDGAIKIRIEVNRYAHLEAGFREEMAKRDNYFIIDAVKAKHINKEGRIKNRLSPLFENGVIYMKRGMRELEEELTTFPYGKHDDLIDALAWQIERYRATDYEKPKPQPKKADFRRFSLEQIRESQTRRFKSPYPFQRQTAYQGMS